MTTLTHGSLFAGVEGFGQGFRKAGIQTIYCVEKDRDCRDQLNDDDADKL